MDPEKNRLNFIFPTKYVIPKSLTFSHWPIGGLYATYIHLLREPETTGPLCIKLRDGLPSFGKNTRVKERPTCFTLYP